MTPLLLQLLPAIHLALGLLLAALTLAFLLRIVLTWYPQVDLNRGAWPLIAWPTEPFLAATRKVVSPIGGVDVTPVIWVGLLSLVRELLVGQQGLLSQVLMRAETLT
ncbi:MAG: YggT family protein [Synechococcus sp.]